MCMVTRGCIWLEKQYTGKAKLSVLQPNMTCGSVACTRNGRDTTGNTIFIYSRLEFKMAIGTSARCKAQCVARLAW